MLKKVQRDYFECLRLSDQSTLMIHFESVSFALEEAGGLKIRLVDVARPTKS